MTEPHYFETPKNKLWSNYPGRARAILAKGQLLDESRQQRKIAAARKEAMQTQAMIANLGRAALSLDASIEGGIGSGPGPRSFSLLLSNRGGTMRVRCDNLKVTIAVLSDRLASADQPWG